MINYTPSNIFLIKMGVKLRDDFTLFKNNYYELKTFLKIEHKLTSG